MKVDQMLTNAQDAITVKRVFGEPYEKDGVTIIPAAFVLGAGGGGGGADKAGHEGGGGGFHVQGHPVGAYVIKDGKVKWVPAMDPAKLAAVLGFVALGALTIRAKLVKAHLKASRRGGMVQLARGPMGRVVRKKMRKQLRRRLAKTAAG